MPIPIKANSKAKEAQQNKAPTGKSTMRPLSKQRSISMGTGKRVATAKNGDKIQVDDQQPPAPKNTTCFIDIPADPCSMRKFCLFCFQIGDYEVKCLAALELPPR